MGKYSVKIVKVKLIADKTEIMVWSQQAKPLMIQFWLVRQQCDAWHFSFTAQNICFIQNNILEIIVYRAAVIFVHKDIGWLFDLKSVIFEHMLPNKVMNTSCKIVLGWMPQNTLDDKTILVNAMVCCSLATSHYLSQCWGLLCLHITMPKWVKGNIYPQMNQTIVRLILQVMLLNYNRCAEPKGHFLKKKKERHCWHH